MNRMQVLVIDDDAGSAQVVADVLGTRGCDVRSVRSAAEALEKAADDIPDVIFISLFMPGSNGLKISKSLHATDRLKRVPIVMLISHEGELDPKYMSTIGVVDVLVKPLRAAAVLAVSERILGVHALAGEVEEWAPIEEEREIAPAAGVGFFMDHEDLPLTQHEEPPVEKATSAAPPAASDSNLPRDEEADAYLDYQTEDELAQAEEMPEEHASAEPERGVEETHDEWLGPDDLQPEPKKNVMRMVLMAAGGLAVVGGIVIGVWQAKKAFFPSVKKEVVQPVQKEMVRDNMPAAAVKETPPSPAVKEQHVPPPAPVEEKPAVAATPKAEQKPPQVEKKPEPPKEAKPAPKPKQAETAVAQPEKSAPAKEKKSKEAPAAGRISVQLGVFADEANAVKLAAQMKKSGHDAFILRDESMKQKTGKVVHRVLIGHFEERRMAQIQVKQLEKEGITAIVYAP